MSSCDSALYCSVYVSRIFKWSRCGVYEPGTTAQSNADTAPFYCVDNSSKCLQLSKRCYIGVESGLPSLNRRQGNWMGLKGVRDGSNDDFVEIGG
jgi:hypothetical protein